MFGTYLFRELTNRRRQTAIIAIGMGLAIALVIVINSVAAGVRDAQAGVLESVYGVGTDVTVTQQPAPPSEGGGGGQIFQFPGGGDHPEGDGSTELSQTRLLPARGNFPFDSDALATALEVDNVAAATATLSLMNTSFSGTIMIGSDQGTTNEVGQGEVNVRTGPSSFDVDSFTVDGIDVSGAAVGPLTAATLIDGRGLDADDEGKRVVVLDSTYATEEELEVGDTLSIADTDFEVVGIVVSTSSEATTSANSYIPLDVAQELSGFEDQVSTVYVQAESSADIPQIQSDLEAALPDASVNTQADLASSVSGSLSTAAGLVSNLGTWLSLIALAAAFLIAILFTISGVTRRTREFGTLKAVGWSNGRVVRQVAGESLVQGVLGGVLGVAVGLVGVLVVNLVAPTFTAGAPTTSVGVLRGPGGAGGGPGGPAGPLEEAATEIALHAPVTVTVILIAVGLAILGGLLAGAIGGWRAARLRPAEALRSVA